MWTVQYEGAFDAWQAADHPNTDRLVAVLTWILRFIDLGPPDDALPVPIEEDLYVSRVPDAEVFATYLALGHERWAKIRHFRS